MSENNVVDYKQVLADLELKKAQIETAIDGIKAILGVTGNSIIPKNGKAETSIQIDTFIGMSNMDAVIKYLKMCKAPKSTTEIMEALKTGGLDTKYSTISAQLSRRSSNEGDIVALARGTWGLQEFYPDRKFKKKKSNGSEENINASEDEKLEAGKEA